VSSHVPNLLAPGGCDQRALRRFLAQWWEAGRCYRVLDLSPDGALAVEMARRARTRAVTVRIDALGAADAPEIQRVRGTALTFEPGESYDLVLCACALPGLGEDDAVRLLRQCREWSTRWALILDLARQPGLAAALWLSGAPAAAASSAYSFRELAALAAAAGWQGFGHQRYFPARQALWLDRRDLAEIPLDSVGLPSPA
jgi:CheY-like chemotaxis protein